MSPSQLPSAIARAEAGSSVFPTATSPASNSILTVKATSGGVRTHAATTGRTIYAESSSSCSVDTGTGTQASPYCLLQDAVNAAAPGDTIDVLEGYYQESVTVRTSGISIVGISAYGRPRVSASNGANGKPALVLDGVSNVTVSNMELMANGTSAIEIKGSSAVTLDSDLVDVTPVPALSAITMDGTSSNVTVSRSYVDPGTGGSTVGGIAIASGARNITLASNVLATTGITATGVSGLDIIGNTIQRGCGPAVDIEGASTGVHLENNLFEDANPTTDTLGYKSQCVSFGEAWAPDVTVGAGSGAGTASDYNDFFSYGSDATAPYNWAGTTYPTLAGFQSAVAQGLHDTIDSKQPVKADIWPNQTVYADILLPTGSAAINSADPNAPGKLSTDLYGVSPYISRGAIQWVDSNPTLAVALSGQDTSAYGVSLTTSVTSAPVWLTISIAWGDGTTDTVTNWGVTGIPVSKHSYAALGRYDVTVTVTDISGNSVSNNLRVATAGSDYTPYGPARLLDTRAGIGAPQAKVQPYASVRLQIAGNGGIPAGTTAVALNVTVTDTATPGHITAYPDGTSLPSTSNLNFNQGQTVPNLVIVPVGADGYVDLNNGSWGTVNLIADVAGYFTRSSSSGYTPLSPNRLVDTRNGTGTVQGQVGGTSSFTVQIAGAGGGMLPVSGVTAVALNVTVTNPQSDGWVSAYPDGQPTPTVSNLNFIQGETVANSVIAPIGADGKITIHNGAWAPTDVVVDVVGYYSPGSKSAYLPIAPQRMLDTRDKSTWSGGPLPGGDYVYNPVSPDMPDITGVVLNTTVTNTSDAGHLTVSPDPNTLNQYNTGTFTQLVPPNSSVLNWTAGQTVPNLVQASTGANGIIDDWNVSYANIDLIIDMFGFYQND